MNKPKLTNWCINFTWTLSISHDNIFIVKQ